MVRSLPCLLGSTALFLTAAHPAFAAESDAESRENRDNIVVTGLLQKDNSSATGLPLTLKETPQSVTIIDRDRINAFALTNVNDLLSQTVGINVERVETDRTYFNSRGFDVTNFQVDGTGLPLRWGIQFGDLDTALFERVEAVRGANAIMTGIGNPSATINYVRKRPTKETQAYFALSAGSWDTKRIEADVSGALNTSGTIAARVIFAHEDRDSYLRYNHVNRTVFGGILAWEMTPHLTATVGYTRQDNNADGVLWGALPLTYTNGERIAYPVSASTSADWTYWNVSDRTTFGELAYAADNGWQLRGRFTWNQRKSYAKLLYAYGYPDVDTGEGVGGMTGKYRSPSDQYLGDVYASGPVTLFGRQHELAFGVSHASTDSREYEAFPEYYPAYPSVSQWGWSGAQIAQPEYPDYYRAEKTNDKLTRVYGAIHLSFTDQLKVVAGASAMWLKSTGESYGTDESRKDSAVSPYLGATYEVTPNISLYASYTDIFNPQVEVDANNRKLDPAKGTSIEGGIKSEWFNQRLYVTASLFRAKQKGLAEAAGTFGADGPGKVGDTYYTGVDTTSRGFEIEIAGHVTDNWTLSGGYTGLKIENEDGDPTRTYLPTKSLKLATTYKVPEWNALEVGAQLRWQNRITYADAYVQDYGVVTGDVIVRQNGYTVLDLMAGVNLVEQLRLSVNVRNVTNRKYLGSLMWGQAYYAAPRNVMATLRYQY